MKRLYEGHLAPRANCNYKLPNSSQYLFSEYLFLYWNHVMVYTSRKLPVRAWACCWCPSLCWGAGGLCLCRRRSGNFSGRVGKQLYSFGEDQGRLPAGLPGEKENQTLRSSPHFFFLNKMMTFPVFWVMKKNTVEFCTCNLQFIFSMPKQYLCRTIGCLWMSCFRPTTWRTWFFFQSNFISFPAMRFQLIDMQVINN